jgi:hypothetical protein
MAWNLVKHRDNFTFLLLLIIQVTSSTKHKTNGKWRSLVTTIAKSICCEIITPIGRRDVDCQSNRWKSEIGTATFPMP